MVELCGVCTTIVLVVALTPILLLIRRLFKCPFRQTAHKRAEFDALKLTDREEDKIVRQRFTEKRIPEKLDAIVIGSGIGSMSCAAILANKGYKVLMLEQHDVIGGCCHTYTEHGYEFDTGIHYVGNMSPGSTKRVLLDHITAGQLEWAQMEKQFDIAVVDGRQYPIGETKADFRRMLYERFPDERAAIDEYLRLCDENDKQGIWFAMLKMILPRWCARSLARSGFIHRLTNWFSTAVTQDVVERLTSNRDLQMVFVYNYGDYGVMPSESPFLMQAALMNHYLVKGAWYPLGGSKQIALNIVPVITQNGGAALVNAPVKKILLDGGRACGVSVSHHDEDIYIHAPLVVSGCGVINTFHRLLPPEVATKAGFPLNHGAIRGGVTALTLFIGLRGTKEQLGLRARNMWVFADDNLHSTEKFLTMSVQDAAESPVPLLFISFPSTKDPDWARRFPDRSTCEVVTFCKYEWFEAWHDTVHKRRGKDYENLKDLLGSQMWKQTLELFPHLHDAVDYFEVGTPLTVNHYLGSMHGEVYGLHHGMDRFDPVNVVKLRPKTKVKGLYLTGQDIMTAGFSGALNGGFACASEILRHNYMIDLILYKLLLK